MIGTANTTQRISSADWINYLNIALMLISLGAAYILPFELFLFSYAVLGPLHYLTEISWLDKKNYFVKSKNDMLVLVVLVILITWARLDSKSIANMFYSSLVFLAFVYTLIILFIKNSQTKIILSIGAFVVSIVFNFNKFNQLPFLLFAVWLPTIIHVYLFTGAFILFGALKSRSFSGMISLIVFVCCPLACLLFMPANIDFPVTDYGKNAYAPFGFINTSLYNFFGFGTIKKTDVALYTAPKAVAIMRFIAFAYTYHYLNWFSKTKVIKWNQVSKRRISFVILLWLASVILYAISYRIGFYALFFLSMMHVFFEFPLNHYTFIGIGKEIRQRLARGK